MDDKTSSTSVSAEQTVAEQKIETPAKAETEHRQAYGTAKTENLRDSGLWRILLPALVVVCCVALLAIPLIILVPLLTGSIDALRAGNAAESQLMWVWISMIVIEVVVAIVIIRGLLKIFLTQAGNYRA